MKSNKFTASYLRFNRQLKALQKGKINLVKKLALDAKNELEANANLYQLKINPSL